MSLGVRERPTTIRVSRIRRFEARNRRRRWTGLIVVIVVVVASGAWFAASRPTPRPRATVTVPSAPVREVETLLLVVRVADRPFLAVIGGGSSPVAMPIPSSLRIEAPGLGPSSIGDLVALRGDAMRISISNAMGMWIDHYAVMDLQRLGVFAGRDGGLTVTLPKPVTIEGRVFGPGAATMDAHTLSRYLGDPGPAPDERWDVVLTALTSTPPDLRQGDPIDTDGVLAASTVLSDARGATVETFPSNVVAGTVRVPDYRALDASVGRLFGTSGRVVPVIVQNGSGLPNQGQAVARMIVPLGYRIVLTENETAFDTRVTHVIAMGRENLDAARRAQQAIGTGTVEISRVPSGIGDIAIDVGSDFSS